jgi:hypothetical protein
MQLLNYTIWNSGSQPFWLLGQNSKLFTFGEPNIPVKYFVSNNISVRRKRMILFAYFKLFVWRTKIGICLFLAAQRFFWQTHFVSLKFFFLWK